MTERQEQIRTAMQNLRRLTVALQREVTPRWLELDLTMAQLKGLFVLAREREAHIGQVAAALGIGEPAASLLVDRLVRAGFVERAEDASDRRRTITRLTTRGDNLIAELRHGSRASLERWLGRLSPADLDAFNQGAGALVAAAEAVAAGPKA